MQLKNKLYSLWSKFLTFFGNIKIFKYPFFMVYDPSEYDVTGQDILNVMELIEPGDVVLRYYKHYLDSKFIPGRYSHAGLYAGNNEIIHAVSPHVEKINVVDFMQCDRIMVLRPAKYKRQAIKKAKEYLLNKIPYDFWFTRGDSALYCFELVAECYDKLRIERKNTTTALIFKRKDALLSTSLIESPDFSVVYTTDIDG